MAKMNAKQIQHLGELHAKFNRGDFSEMDVSALMVLLREKSRGGPILELAHSVVHSERDSGLFFKRMKENRDVLNNLGKKAGVVYSGDIFSSDDFSKNLDETFQRYEFVPLPKPIDDLIFLCCLSLLQGSSAKAGKKFGELSLAVTSGRFELHATISIIHNNNDVKVSFPIASVENRWIPICNPRAHVNAQGIIRITVENALPVIEGIMILPLQFGHVVKRPWIARTRLG